MARHEGSRVASLRGTIAAYSRWSCTGDRVAATDVARAAFWTKLEREVDPDGTLSPTERGRRADAARKAHFARMALLSIEARAKQSKKQPRAPK